MCLCHFTFNTLWRPSNVNQDIITILDFHFRMSLDEHLHCDVYIKMVGICSPHITAM